MKKPAMGRTGSNTKLNLKRVKLASNVMKAWTGPQLKWPWSRDYPGVFRMSTGIVNTYRNRIERDLRLAGETVRILSTT